MNRSLVVLSFCSAIWMSSCSNAPKATDSESSEDVAMAQLNMVEEEPMAEAPVVEVLEKEEESSDTDQPKPIEKKKVLSETKASTSDLEKPRKPKPVVKPKPKSVAKPKVVAKTFANISFDKLVHEFGEIDEGDKITHKFKFRNTGNGPLIIDNVDVSCGCTMPTYPIIPIGPGETGEIGVIYNSKGKFGTQKPSITIKTNATQPIVKLYMSGSIKHVFEKPVIDTTDTEG